MSASDFRAGDRVEWTETVRSTGEVRTRDGIVRGFVDYGRVSIQTGPTGQGPIWDIHYSLVRRRSP